MEKMNSHPGTLQHGIAIAVAAHADRVDKAGAPYILHPLRVMFSLTGDLARTVGVLHDVVEDCPDWSFERLRAEGFSEDVISALRSVTKTADDEGAPGDSAEVKLERYLRFVRRAGADPVGRLVKLADLENNLDVTRLGAVTPKDAQRLSKYLAARQLLIGAA